MWTAEKSAVKSANIDYQNCLIYFLTIFTLVKSILLPNFSGAWIRLLWQSKDFR